MTDTKGLVERLRDYLANKRVAGQAAADTMREAAVEIERLTRERDEESERAGRYLIRFTEEKNRRKALEAGARDHPTDKMVEAAIAADAYWTSTHSHDQPSRRIRAVLSAALAAQSAQSDWRQVRAKIDYENILTAGKDYVVSAISSNRVGEYFKIIDDNDQVASLLSTMFESSPQPAPLAVSKAVDALTSAESWIDRHADHLGSCAGGDKCTCGKTAILHEIRQALASLPSNEEGG